MKTLFAVIMMGLAPLAWSHEGSAVPHFVHIGAKDKFERTKIADLGVSVEAIMSDSVYGVASDSVLENIRKSDLRLLETFPLKEGVTTTDFPSDDSRFHNYAEMTKALEEIVEANKDLMTKFSIGKSLQGREIWCVQVNSSQKARAARGDLVSAKPGVVFMGNHHAREHVSAEIPLMLLRYLGENRHSNRGLANLLAARDVYVIPMVNPDGVEYDISTGKYKWHRKNMRPNATSRPGVDLNRNYGYKWGTGGSSKDPSSDVYMGPEPFSEPETQAVKGFVENHPNLKVLLSFHTFSELILYPWGHSYDPVSSKEDKGAFEAMASKMAGWNGYKPQPSSALYIASGDTVDWAYGTFGIFAFTFELTPKDMFDGGFYPGAGVLDKVFADNLKPALYLIDLADDPRKASFQRAEDTDWIERL